jgi:site-specific DNA recombinase
LTGPDLKAEWNSLQERKSALQAKLDSADEAPPLLHPGMAELYRQKVTDLAQALETPDTRTEAAEAIRGLVDAIVLVPTEGELRIELKGNLAAMLSAAENAKRSPETGDLLLQVAMVAGARNKLYRQLCWAAA